MIVSWNWLKEYILLDMPLAELEDRLSLSGLNHEGTKEIDGDFAIDLEVTSNRPDCLGHLGIAREISALYGHPVQIPAANPAAGKTPVDELTSVEVQCPDLCRRYTARVIRGVKVGPSPSWMVQRLKTLDPSMKPINNIVDITNYVLMECGQPLHAFDLEKVRDRKIIVREARPGEKLEAIDHKTYELTPGMCVIADAQHPTGLGGVMGGAESEISDGTTDLLIESAEFDPVSIRNTSRALKLKSESSYRFERGVDPVGVEWASRRCCELILELAGGELAEGMIDVGQQPAPRSPITLRLRQLKRVLGIDIPGQDVRRILEALGMEEHRVAMQRVEVIPPSWRRDVTREIDLVEEVARIYGYDNIPEDIVVPMAPSHKDDRDRVLETIRHVVTAHGYDEAITVSAVNEELSASFSPWSDAEPLQVSSPVLKKADLLRRSLVPSLLLVRGKNEAIGNEEIELFETAKVYLPRENKLPVEPTMLSLCSGGDYLTVKGTIEAVVAGLNAQTKLNVAAKKLDLLEEETSVELRLGEELLGYLGKVAADGLERFKLRNACTVAELNLDLLVSIAELIPQYKQPSPFPASTRQLNFLVSEAVRWSELESCARHSGGEFLEDLRYVETYRSEQLGKDKKSVLMELVFRGQTETLTSDAINSFCDAVVARCTDELGAELREA